MKQTRFVDGLFFSKKAQLKEKRRYWLWFLIVPILISLLFVGKISASYILPNLNLLSLFRDGKFLVLFQNNSEIRSSGGFIGSYATVEVKNYEVQNISFNTNIYALDRAFSQNNYIEPPAPVKKMLKGETWALRDANYDASFDEAAKDITYFYETETGDRIDGIIALNAEVILDLLKITGPIYLSKYNLTLTADNFYKETQYQVEKAYYENPENWVLNEPKTFLKDLYPAILERAMQNKIKLWQTLKNDLATKEIIFYFKDSAKQKLIEKHHLAGKIPTEQELKDLFSSNKNVDYLYINSNSYSGNKSSLSIKEDIDYRLTEVEDNGLKMYQANLKISRIHGGTYDWPDGKNLEWVRVFVPHSTQFIEAKINEKNVSSEVEVGSESNKTYFGTEVVTEPGQANIIELSYLIPYEPDYHLLIQKQPGKNDTFLTVNVLGKMFFDGVLDRDFKISDEQ